ncbi:MAG: PfkB family carbohydrate kinase [Verrucomicrobiota bacterium]
MKSSPATNEARAYDALIGTGGIGTGSFFALRGNHTLGREESRGGTFLDRRDYCKLHIISHYVQKLMGSGFQTLPIGSVGDDDAGRALIGEMRAAGLDISCTAIVPGHQTLNCVCLLYPDGSGGNLTATDSASGSVTPADIRKAIPCFEKYAGRGIALAVPEVPLEARLEVLDLGKKYRFLRAASFSSEEMATVKEQSLLAGVDLLAINLDEAARLAGTKAREDPQAIAKSTVESLTSRFPRLRLSITAGAFGSWTFERGDLRFLPSPAVEVISAAGAGDAHFSGILAGLASGLSLAEAHQIGALAGAMSVTSPHTIHPGIDRPALLDFARNSRIPLSESASRFLQQP